MRHWRFFLLSLLWLPAGIVARAALLGFPAPPDPSAWIALALTAPGGLPLALACRAIRRRGRKRTALAAFAVLAPVTVLVGVAGGLLGPLWVLVAAAVASLPAWILVAILRRRR